ncbi:MAG: peroxiredoxin-like family protein [Chloroflexi bacterium]|nr:peroxiredoxin-like family protein [Chloroflexota bacterium]
MEQVAPETAGLTVLTPQGEATRLGDLWTDRPVLLVLVRHYGCLFCRQQLADLRGVWSRIEVAGVQPVVIGNGTPLMAEAFAEETGLEVPLYTNPGREVYAALGTKRPGLRAFFHPRLYWNGLRATLRGFFPKAPKGDPAQLGGVFLVRPGGEMPYAYRSDLAGDHPSSAELLRVVGAT